MSLMRIALRVSAVEALRNKTFAETNVLDSEIGAIDIATDGNIDSNRTSPFISVYTAEASGVDKNGINFLGPMKMDLVFDAAVSAQMFERGDDGEMVLGTMPVTPNSDAAYEISLDVLQYQISAALGDVENPWAEIVRKILSGNIEAIEVTVGRSSKNQRLAARQIRVTATLCAEPVNLGCLSDQHPFNLFLAQLDAGDACDEARDEDFKNLATALRDVLSASHMDWKLNQFRYGMGKDELDSLLVTSDYDTDITSVDFSVGVTDGS